MFGLPIPGIRQPNHRQAKPSPEKSQDCPGNALNAAVANSLNPLATEALKIDGLYAEHHHQKQSVAQEQEEKSQCQESAAAQERQEALRREEQRNVQALIALDTEIKLLRAATTRDENDISYYEKRLTQLDIDLQQAQKEITTWEKEAANREESLLHLRNGLTRRTKEYAEQKALLEKENNDRLEQLKQETDSRIALLQKNYAGKSDDWGQKIGHIESEINDLDAKKIQEEQINSDLSSQIENSKRGLITRVTVAIRNDTAQTEAVLHTLNLIGGDKQILHTTEHVQNVSLLIALILSGKFKKEDLSSSDSNYQSIPKIFFKNTRKKLLKQAHEKLTHEDFDGWIAQLTQLGQKN